MPHLCPMASKATTARFKQLGREQLKVLQPLSLSLCGLLCPAWRCPGNWISHTSAQGSQDTSCLEMYWECSPLRTLELWAEHFFFFSCFLGPHLRHMEVPRLGVRSELHLPATDATGTAMRDTSHVCNLHHSSQQPRSLNPLSEARDQTCILTDTSWVHFCCTTTGTPKTLSNCSCCLLKIQATPVISPFKK